MLSAPRLYYHCYDTNLPRGGQKSVYQHVDVLNHSGYTAFAVHSMPGYRLRWFENDTRVITWSEVWRTFDPRRDYLVFPEDMGARLAEYPGRKVIFNKNLFYGYWAASAENSGFDPYALPELAGVLAVSEHNFKHLKFAYPALTVCHVWENVDSGVFRFAPLKEKKRQIAYLPKSKLMLRAIHQTFRAREQARLNNAIGVPWIALENITELQAAQLLHDSIAFVFTSVEEGLSRACLEALLSGCVVFAFGNGPLVEYLPPNFCFEYGDAIGIVQAMERLLNSEFQLFESDVRRGRESALRYGPEQQCKSVCAAWETIFSQARLSQPLAV
jgi:hypothetical protein